MPKIVPIIPPSIAKIIRVFSDILFLLNIACNLSVPINKKLIILMTIKYILIIFI